MKVASRQVFVGVEEVGERAMMNADDCGAVLGMGIGIEAFL